MRFAALVRGGLVLSAWGLSLAAAYAQFGLGAELNTPMRPAPKKFPDRNFVVCRLAYTQVRSEPDGVGWRTDYPYGEINLTIRLSELTKTSVSRTPGREPNHYVVEMDDDALFQCPIVMASDAGTIGFDEEEAARLREYLLKGGFLWVDDFWGTQAWEHWSREIGKALPPSQFAIEEVSMDDPIFRSQFVVTRVPQVTNIFFWRDSGGRETRERGSDSERAHLRAIRDAHGRIMVVMTFNTDLADSWEREGEDPAFFHQFSPDGYAIGINVLLHALTH